MLPSLVARVRLVCALVLHSAGCMLRWLDGSQSDNLADRPRIHRTVSIRLHKSYFTLVAHRTYFDHLKHLLSTSDGVPGCLLICTGSQRFSHIIHVLGTVASANVGCVPI